MRISGLALVLVAALVGAGVATIGNGQAQESARGPDWSGSMWEAPWSRPWQSDRMGPGQRHRMVRHWAFMNRDIPEEHMTVSNDVGYTTTAIHEGGKVYARNCARCHGTLGLGDGEAARDMTPSPALLSFLIRQPIAVDQYLHWTISEGGERFGSQMPAFGETLSKEEIWQVIAYMRAGFPETDEVEASDVSEERPAAEPETQPATERETKPEP